MAYFRHSFELFCIERPSLPFRDRGQVGERYARASQSDDATKVPDLVTLFASKLDSSGLADTLFSPRNERAYSEPANVRASMLTCATAVGMHVERVVTDPISCISVHSLGWRPLAIVPRRTPSSHLCRRTTAQYALLLFAICVFRRCIGLRVPEPTLRCLHSLSRSCRAANLVPEILDVAETDDVSAA